MNCVKSNSALLKEILVKYVMKVSRTRRLLFPTLMVMVVAKLMEVKVADLYRDISRAIKDDIGQTGILIKYIFIYAISIILGELQSYFICKAGQTGYRLANRDTYNDFIRLAPENLKTHGKGEIQNTISRKAQAVQDIIDVFTLNFAPTFFTILFVSYTVFFRIGYASMVMINIAIVAYAIITVKITKRRNITRVRINKAANTVSNIQVDGLLNHDTVYTYNNQAVEIERYDHALKHLEVHSTDLEQSKYFLNLAQRSVWCILSVSIITFATFGILGEKMTPEELSFFIGVIAILIKSLDNFGFMYGKYQAALINMRLAELRPEINSHRPIRSLYGFSNKITVKNLVLYSNGKILSENINVEIRRGEKIAIIGKNGAGKSTFIKSILKIKQVPAGSIFIDKVDICDINDLSFRAIVSYVPQDPHLFNDTLIYNIKYGAPKASDEEIYKKSKDLALHQSIARMADGYETKVGEQGSALSGGERQKTAILRALLRQSPILIMDEPTASLDKQSEEKILRYIAGQEDLTVITIVHNLALLDIFDRVLCVEKDGVREVHDISQLNIESWAPTETD
ncbi:ATP-binding cassette, subfamily B (MDR/TAP), member 7 [Pancytospora epiphaga]|nr:ATP-binding cassette, subfamily B (MDR/TAP), member 7 [Pancytospora epiphaga]